jgi:hypothetical protein
MAKNFKHFKTLQKLIFAVCPFNDNQQWLLNDYNNLK